MARVCDVAFKQYHIHMQYLPSSNSNDLLFLKTPFKSMLNQINNRSWEFNKGQPDTGHKINDVAYTRVSRSMDRPNSNYLRTILQTNNRATL